MSSDRLFLDRVARQHCPSPLHRCSQINMHSSQAQAKGDVSTLPGRGHFYFALTLWLVTAVPLLSDVIAYQRDGERIETQAGKARVYF